MWRPRDIGLYTDHICIIRGLSEKYIRIVCFFLLIFRVPQITSKFPAV